MLDYRRELLFGVTRIQTTFVEALNPPRVGVGTGFWLRLVSGVTCFVTNKHNVDPSIKFPGSTLRLETIGIELRRNTGTEREPAYEPETRYFEVDDGSKIYVTPNTDCALLVPKFKEPIDGYSIVAPFEEPDLADVDFFEKVLMPAQEVYFIGFAGKASDSSLGKPESHWWDTKYNLPIVRSAVIASMPFLNFNNAAIKTEDVILVSGMSFGGSSGSPVISREVGFRAKPPVICERYAPERILGIMSGHWWAESDYPEVFKHSGLSYLTRSTSILHLIHSHEL